MWIGGDGSSKLYRQLNSTTWITPAEEFRDTIKFASGEYTRTLAHGVKVVFDNTGRHLRTTNRQTQVTNFYWHSASQLDSVRVPPVGAGGKTFILHYNGSSLLDSVLVSGRDVGVGSSGGNLTQWRWPDGTYMSFHTGANGKIDSTFADDSAATRLHYGAHGLLDTAKVWYDVAGSATSAVTAFNPWQAVGYGTTPADTSLAFTSILGPRHVGDSAQFHVDKWGAPLSMFDADRQTTRYQRTDARYPALLTRADFPNFRRVTLVYDTLYHGNLLSLTDSAGDPGSFKTKREFWSYLDSNDPESPSQAIGTDSTITVFTYNTFGLTATVTDARLHVTSYGYVGAGASVGLLSTVTEDYVPVWIEAAQTDSLRQLVTTLTRDTSGNIISAQNPAGGKTKYQRDATFGQPTQVDNPVGLRTRYGYDVLGRQVNQRVIFAVGDASNGCANQREFVCGDSAIVGSLNPAGDSAVTTMVYSHGLLAKVVDPRGVKRSYLYDRRRQLSAEVDEAGRRDSTFYDAGGLIIRQVNRDRRTITYAYDASGRDTMWIMPPDTTGMYATPHVAPPDTVRSVYDSLGNLLVHRNRLGSIVRTYANSGVIVREVRRPAASGPKLVADSVDMAYDRFGRLDTLRWGPDVVRYRFNSGGDLAWILTDWKNGATSMHDSVGFHWDSLGRRQQVVYPFNSMTSTSHYDRLSTLRREVVANTATLSHNRFVDSVVANKVDLLGRVLHQAIYCPGMTTGDAGNPCGDIRAADDTTKYNRLGAAVVQAITAVNLATDTFKYDPSGNRIYHAARNVSSPMVSNFIYPDSSNRVSSETDSLTGGTTKGTYYFGYDSLGARRVKYAVPTSPIENYQYDAVGRMVGSAQTGSPSPIISENTCTYDADTRAVQPCGAGAVTLLGEQVIHDPNGNWFYVYAPGVDQPILAIRRNPVDTTLFARLDIVSDGSGRLVALAEKDGQLNSIYAQQIPGSNGGPWGSGITPRSESFSPRRWATVIAGDTLSTFRTRQYDPATGRWLQEDPAGLAGGVNLYEYNRNDPSSFTDPFGLCPRYAGGDGATPTAADCPRDVLDRWEKSHIHVGEGVDWAGVDAALRDAIIRASIDRDEDLYVSAGKEPGHAPASFHHSGDAADLSRVNGRKIAGMTDSEAERISAGIVGALKANLPACRLAEMMSPAGIERFYAVVPYTPARVAELKQIHRSHVHVAVKPCSRK